MKSRSENKKYIFLNPAGPAETLLAKRCSNPRTLLWNHYFSAQEVYAQGEQKSVKNILPKVFAIRNDHFREGVFSGLAKRFGSLPLRKLL